MKKWNIIVAAIFLSFVLSGAQLFGAAQDGFEDLCDNLTCSLVALNLLSHNDDLYASQALSMVEEQEFIEHVSRLIRFLGSADKEPVEKYLKIRVLWLSGVFTYKLPGDEICYSCKAVADSVRRGSLPGCAGVHQKFGDLQAQLGKWSRILKGASRDSVGNLIPIDFAEDLACDVEIKNLIAECIGDHDFKVRIRHVFRELRELAGATPFFPQQFK